MNQTTTPDSQAFCYEYFSWIKQRYGHQATLTGTSGAGKSSLIRGLEMHLKGTSSGFERFMGAGDLMRERARQLGMNISDFVRHMEAHPEEGHDKWCDDQVINAGKRDGVIVEGRKPHIFMPNAFHVLVVCDSEICAARSMKKEREINPAVTFDEVLAGILERDRRDAARYAKIYPGSDWGRNCFDLVIESDHLTVEAEVELFLSAHAKWVSSIATENLLTGN